MIVTEHDWVVGQMMEMSKAGLELVGDVARAAE
jgi:hypothetical protein